MDASSFVLSGDFGYVVLVMIFSVFMLMWMGGKVGGARKKYEVPVSYSIIILHFNRHDSHLDYILIQNTKLSWQPLCYWPQFPVSSVAWILIYFKICLKSIFNVHDIHKHCMDLDTVVHEQASETCQLNFVLLSMLNSNIY